MKNSVHRSRKVPKTAEAKWGIYVILDQGVGGRQFTGRWERTNTWQTFLQGHPETMRHRGESSEQIFAWLLPVCHTSFISTKVNMLSFPSIWMSLGRKEGGVNSAWVCWALIFSAWDNLHGRLGRPQSETNQLLTCKPFLVIRLLNPCLSYLLQVGFCPPGLFALPFNKLGFVLFCYNG